MIEVMDDQTQKFLDFLARVRSATGWSTTEIAKRAGLAATTLTRPVKQGDAASSPTLRTITKIVQVSGVPFDVGGDSSVIGQASVVITEPPYAKKLSSNVVFAPDVRVPVASEMPRDLPVRGIAACSSGDGAFQVGADVVDWVRRPPLFNGVPEAYALYMSGDSMEPRLFHGDLVMVHPFRPVRPGDLAIFVLKDAADEPEYSFCKVFQSDRGGIVTVEQYNPRMTREFPRDRIIARHRVMELRDLFGA